MTTKDTAYTSNYLLHSSSVLHAGKWLRGALPEANQARLEFAIKELEKAAQQQETGGIAYRAFMFSTLESAPEADRQLRGRLTEDVLASVLTDLQVADVLLAAGQTVGEIGENAEPRLLDESLLRLEATVQAIEQSFAGSAARELAPGYFGFAETAKPALTPPSDLASAIDTFRNCSIETLTTLVSEAKETVNSAITALPTIDTAALLSVLANMGAQVQNLPKIGRLICLGIEKLEKSIKALLRLFGSDSLAAVTAQIKQLWHDLKSGKQVTRILESTFGIDTTRTHIMSILGSATLKQESLNDASSAVVQLATAFKENMVLCQRLTAAVGLAGTLLALVPAIGPEAAALAAASAYVLIVAAVLLIGMDYADSGRLLGRVRGVRTIASSLLVA